jgi:hypothetical protein
MTETRATTHWTTIVVGAVWLLSAVYMGANLNSRWDPVDEGTLGQSAERILHGDMPHRDFDDPYTGGLAYVDAGIFKLFGINLFWLRLFLFAFFLAWVPAVYTISREFLTLWPAAGVTLIAVAWSVPNYPAAMPSWFNIFFATFGILALAKYIRKAAVHWLILAGLCGGVSFLIKSVALYYIAAVLLFFVYREQLLSRNQRLRPRRTPLFLTFLTLCLSIFALSLIKLVFTVGGTPEYLHFVFPGFVIALLLLARERMPPSVPSASRFKTLFQMAVPFLLASAVPIGLFFAFYWYHNALPSLMNGLFVTPLRRIFFAREQPSGLLFEYPSVIAALLIMETAKLCGQPRRVLSFFLVLFAAVVLLASRNQDLAFIVGLTSALGIIPVLALAGCLALFAQPQVTESGSESHQRVALLLTMAALFSLIQFPYATPGYFYYLAPLAALLAAALTARLARPPRIILCSATVFYILFPIYVIRPYFQGSHLHPAPENTPLLLSRVGGLHVTRESAKQFEELIPFVKNLAGENQIFAGPDSPEVYFLAGLKNPTPFLFDSLRDPDDYEREVRSLFDSSDFIKVAVLNNTIGTATHQLLVLRSFVEPRFPQSHKIGKFTVYWRP